MIITSYTMKKRTRDLTAHTMLAPSASASERGFVSIFSVLIIMAVLTLIMVGFSQIVRRASVSNINDQLSTQAFYAAESGVNDTITYLNGLTTIPNKTTCKGAPFTSAPFTGYDNNLDANLNVGYTCILINASAPDIRYSSVELEGSAAPRLARLESSTGTVPETMEITLDAKDGNGTVANGVGLKPQAGRLASDIGILRVDIVPTSGDMLRDSLVNGTYSFFLNFNDSGTGGKHRVRKGIESGEMVSARCAPPSGPCKAKIELKDPVASTYVLRLQAIYSPLNVVIDNVEDTSKNPVILKNGQVVVDSTGQANGVYRRIQVRLPTLSGLSPSFSLQTGDSICKRLLVAPLPEVSNTDSVDPACQIN